MEEKFSKDIIKILEYLEFDQISDEKFCGKGRNVRNNPDIKFEYNNYYIYCYKDFDTLLFTVPCDIKTGYFIVLLQAFGIFHERFVYERVEGIYEDFFERLEDEDY